VLAYVGAVPAPVERPEPALAPDDLLVEVEAAAFGAPELAALGAGRPVAPGGAAVGRVVAAGAAAGERVGQRVLVGPVQGCGECAVCRRGHPGVCPARVRLGVDRDGALASHVVARARWTTALAGPLEGAVAGPEAAVLPREAALAYEMIVRAGVAPGETTIWLGRGPIALLGMDIARAKGAAAHALEPDELSLPDPELAAAVAARLGGAARPWRIFETSARARGRARAAALGGPGATLAFLAGDDGALPSALLDDDVTVLAVAAPHPDLLPELVALAARGEIDVGAAAWIAAPARLGEIIAALRTGALERLAVVRFG
jgi:hypothetical protein